MNITDITNLTKRCLHLCDDFNFKEIILSYLLDYNTFVTKDIEFWEKEFSKNGLNVKIKSPDSTFKKGEKAVVDGSSLGNSFLKYEKKIEKLSQVVSVYNLNKLDSSAIKELVAHYDKMILSVNNIRMLSNRNLDIEKKLGNLDPELVEKLIKKELKNILLVVLSKKPMCGTDLVKALYGKFKVFVSPGMIYPMLHELEKDGLLKYEYELKNKIYSVNQKEQAEIFLEKYREANSLISLFLQTE